MRTRDKPGYRPLVPWTLNSVQPTYCCNAELLKYYRDQRGWTQEEFGRRAGYSRRLISKAEAGKSIASDTVADLADALNTKDAPVYPEDLVTDPVEFAKRYIDAFYLERAAAIDSIAEFLAEDVVFLVQGDPAEIPFAGTFRGHAGVAEMCQKFYMILEVPDGYDHRPNYRYIGAGNQVIVWGSTWIHPIGQPLTEPVEISIRMLFKRGKMVHFEDRYDVKKTVALLADSKRQAD